MTGEAAVSIAAGKRAARARPKCILPPSSCHWAAARRSTFLGRTCFEAQNSCHTGLMRLNFLSVGLGNRGTRRRGVSAFSSAAAVPGDGGQFNAWSQDALRDIDRRRSSQSFRCTTPRSLPASRRAALGLLARRQPPARRRTSRACLSRAGAVRLRLISAFWAGEAARPVLRRTSRRCRRGKRSNHSSSSWRRRTALEQRGGHCRAPRSNSMTTSGGSGDAPGQLQVARNFALRCASAAGVLGLSPSAATRSR